MLLVIDIGNTSITFGLFHDKKLKRIWRFPTKKTAGYKYFSKTLPKTTLKGAIISSVVPEINSAIKKSIRLTCKVDPIFVNHKNAGIKIGYPKPKEIGADRLVDAVAAWNKYKSSCIIVDFGTATTLDFIDSRGYYMGGSIAPGILLANKALSDAASKLPKINVVATKRMVPKTTISAMQTGVYQGYIGLTEHLIKMTIKEIGGKPKIIATGGLAPLILKGMSIPAHHEPLLTLEGLRIVWDKCQISKSK